MTSDCVTVRQGLCLWFCKIPQLERRAQAQVEQRLWLALLSAAVLRGIQNEVYPSLHDTHPDVN